MINRREFLGLGLGAGVVMAMSKMGSVEAQTLGASDDVQRYHGMVSGSIGAIGYPSIELVAANSAVVLGVKEVVLSAAGLQSKSGLVVVRFAVWFQHPDGAQHPIHSLPGHGVPAPGVGEPVNAARFHDDWFFPADGVEGTGQPLPNCSIRVGFTAQGGQPNSNTLMTNGFGRFRLLYQAMP